jgi:hypothetical protein
MSFLQWWLKKGETMTRYIIKLSPHQAELPSELQGLQIYNVTGE